MSVYQKIKALADKYQVVLACSATAATTYFVVQNVKNKEFLEELIVSLTVLRSEYDEVLEFLDKKNLRNEFLEFTKKANESS